MVRIFCGGSSELIQLMSCPQVRRQLLHKLCRRIDPIEILQSSRKRDALERVKEVISLGARKSPEIVQLFCQREAFGWKFEIVVDDFAQQAREKAKGKPAKGRDALNREFSRFWRIFLKIFSLEVAGSIKPTP